jgi:glyceraldehyde 3-phosphate dehydrogenase
MTVRIAINGFGRMGRALYRIIDQRGLDLEVVAVNELGPAPTMANLLARDSVHGRFGPKILVGEGGLRVGERWVRTFAERDPAALPWAELGVNVVVESTGHFRTRESAAAHLVAGAERVVVSAPC